MDFASSSPDVPAKVANEFILSADRVARVKQLVAERRTSESEIVEKALDLFFGLADFFESPLERQEWYRLSEPALERLWDNDQDAAYDNWKALYGL